MKLLSIFLSGQLANAQYTNTQVSTSEAKFATSVFNTMTICNDWIERALGKFLQMSSIWTYSFIIYKGTRVRLWSSEFGPKVSFFGSLIWSVHFSFRYIFHFGKFLLFEKFENYESVSKAGQKNKQIQISNW